MGASLFEQMIEVIGSDYNMVYTEIIRQRHGLTNDRVALFGVSLGVILSGSIFVHEGFGQRLLGAIGHFDIPRFARTCIFNQKRKKARKQEEKTKETRRVNSFMIRRRRCHAS